MHSNKSYLYSCFFFLMYSFTVHSQSYLIQTEELSIEDGLSNRFVRSIVQDTKGFMWFATKNGLNRYDGHEFKVFTQKNTNLQSDFIDKIFEDIDSNLWIGHAINNEERESFNAIDILNTNTFETQSLETYLGTKLPFSVQEIYEIYTVAENKYLYITTKIGKVYVYKGDKQLELLYEHEKVGAVRAFLYGKQYYWLYCENELIALDKTGKIKQRHPIEVDQLYRCNFMGEKNENEVWLETNDKYHIYDVFCWNAATNLLEKNKPFKLFKYLYQDRTTIRVFDGNQKEIYSKSFSKKNYFIHTVYVDRQDNIWVGAETKGIFKISYQKNKFRPYLNDVSTRSLIELEGDSVLLLNSYKGQYAYNIWTNEKKLLDTLSYLDVGESKDGKFIWLSGPRIYIKRIEKNDFSKKKLYYYKAALKKKIRTQELQIGSSWAIHEDVNGQVWIGTTHGLSYIKKGADSISYFENYGDNSELGHAIINCLYENKKGLWIGSSKGLYLLNLETGRFQSYNQEMKSSYNYIHHIYEDKNGIFWLSTKGGGVLKFNVKTRHFKQFTKKNGLSHNVIYAVLEDEYGYLWMSSDCGLMRMNPQDNVINTYSPEDGLLHKEFNRKSAYKASNGMLYFGGLSGIIGFDPADFLNEEKDYTRL